MNCQQLRGLFVRGGYCTDSGKRFWQQLTIATKHMNIKIRAHQTREYQYRETPSADDVGLYGPRARRPSAGAGAVARFRDVELFGLVRERA